VDLTVSKVSQFPGPLAEYAREFLGVGDPVTKNSEEYRLEGASICALREPDPSQTFLVEKEDKSQGEVWVSLSPDGQVISMESFAKESTPKGFDQWEPGNYTALDESGLYSKYSASATREVTDTIIRKVSIDTTMIEEMTLKRSLVEYPDRDKAQEAIDRIRQIESDMYNLLNGYQETPYSRDALEFMYGKLQAERQEYISLFTGVTVKENIIMHYNIIPDPAKDNQDYIFSGFSPETGIIPATDENKISLVIGQNSESKPVSNPSAGESQSGVVYRIPAFLPVSISYNGKVIASGNFEIMQLGSLLALPPQFKKFELDLATGMLRTLVME
jgi:hypothetical protein